MRHSITFILFVVCIPHVGFAQDFGCYDMKALNNDVSFGSKVYYRTAESPIYNTDWTEFALDSNVTDGSYRKFDVKANTCTQYLKMEGLVKKGLQEGIWKLYLSASSFYVGRFEKGKKEGMWKGYYLSELGDSTCLSEIEFKRDKYNGITKYYFPNGKLYKTASYKDGHLNGEEIEYFQNDTSELNYIYEWKEYTNGVLDGKYLVYKRSNTIDTATYGIYSFGKKNSRFIDHYNGDKFIVDYVQDKVEGKFIKYFNNGVLACELDYRNNLPYNLLQLNDTAGNRIATTSFNEGTGVLNYYYDNGALVSSVEYVDQSISGKFSRFYKSGSLMEKGYLYTNSKKCFKENRPIYRCEDINLYSVWQLNFADGTDYVSYNEDGSKRDNIYALFSDSLNEYVIDFDTYSNGNLVRSETRWRGLKLGWIKTFYENGQLKETGFYKVIDSDSTKTSQKDGVFKYYHPNGELKAEISYSNGNEIGSAYFYDDSGILKRVKVIESKQASYNVYENDTVNRIDNKGRRQGKWISINLPDFTSGEACNYIPNQIKYFKNDKPTGTWEYYSYDGSQLTERIVWKDALHAYSQRLNTNGEVVQEGCLVNEIENGEWKLYDSNKGYLKYKGSYDCGERSGDWQQFKRNGKPVRTIEYVDGEMINTL